MCKYATRDCHINFRDFGPQFAYNDGREPCEFLSCRNENLARQFVATIGALQNGGQQR